MKRKNTLPLGSPCEDSLAAGKRDGPECSGASLFHDVQRIVKKMAHVPQE